VFLIALGTPALARWGGAERGKNVRCKFDVLSPEVSQEAWSYEHDATIESRRADLHRQVDTQDFVFAERKILSTRTVASSPGNGLAAHAYQNSSQSRSHRINRQARNEIEGHCRRVFLDPTRNDNHHSTPRYVPLGKSIPQGRDRERVSFASAPGAMSETWDVSLCFRGLERKTIEKGEQS